MGNIGGMEKSRTFAACASVIGVVLAASAPAQAATGVRITSATTVAAALPAKSGCGSPIQPAFGAVTAAPASYVPTKTSAILGGRVSQLELISQVQAASANSSSRASLAGQGAFAPIVPAAGNTSDCSRLVLPSLRSAVAVTKPGLLQIPLGSDDFLASKRLPVQRTSFDAEWSRVSHSRLPARLAGSLRLAGGRKVDTSTLAAVNSWTNARVRYVEDRVLYGRSDYWASAGTTLSRRAGDCEDIAIAKMQLLASLGLPQSDMYLTIARDLVRNADHAMLVVKMDGRHWLLDNAANAVLDGGAAHDYRPILSFSTRGTWLHGY